MKEDGPQSLAWTVGFPTEQAITHLDPVDVPQEREQQSALERVVDDPAEKPVPRERVLVGHVEMVEILWWCKKEHRIRETIGRKRRSRFGNNATRQQKSQPDGGKYKHRRCLKYWWKSQPEGGLLHLVAALPTRGRRRTRSHDGRNDRVQRRDSGAWTRKSVGSPVALQSPSSHPIALSRPRAPHPRPAASTASDACVCSSCTHSHFPGPQAARTDELLDAISSWRPRSSIAIRLSHSELREFIERSPALVQLEKCIFLRSSPIICTTQNFQSFWHDHLLILLQNTD